MHPQLPRLVSLLALSLSATAGACGSDDVMAPPPRETGTVRATATTTGTLPDPNGYDLTVDDREPVPLPSNGSASLTGLLVGVHRFALAGLASNCTVRGNNPRQIEVSAATTTSVSFEIACGVPAGRIEVTVATGGTNFDPDGYMVLLDGAAGQAVSLAGSVSFAAVADGSHEVTLSGAVPFCRAEGNPRSVSVIGQTVRVAFDVTCSAALSGRLLAWGTVGDTVRVLSAALDGAQAVNLTPGGSGQGGRWSPDGRRIVFQGVYDSRAGIYVMDADGSNRQRLTTDGGESPAWSPDGRHIVYTRDGLIVMNADGSQQRRITTGSDGAPAWSPDGTAITFSRTDRNRCRSSILAPPFCTTDLYMVHPDGTGQSQLTHNAVGAGAIEPAWAPDAQLIAFSGSTLTADFIFLRARWHLYTVTPGGAGRKRITATPGGNEGLPVWSPDGSAIAYAQAGWLAIVTVGGTPLAAFTQPGLSYPSSWR